MRVPFHSTGLRFLRLLVSLLGICFVFFLVGVLDLASLDTDLTDPEAEPETEEPATPDPLKLNNTLLKVYRWPVVTRSYEFNSISI